MEKSIRGTKKKSLMAKLATELTEKEIEAVSGRGCPPQPSESFTYGDFCPNDN